MRFKGRGRRIGFGWVFDFVDVRENKRDAASGSVEMLNSILLVEKTKEVASERFYISRSAHSSPHYN